MRGHLFCSRMLPIRPQSPTGLTADCPTIAQQNANAAISSDSGNGAAAVQSDVNSRHRSRPERLGECLRCQPVLARHSSSNRP